MEKRAIFSLTPSLSRRGSDADRPLQLRCEGQPSACMAFPHSPLTPTTKGEGANPTLKRAVGKPLGGQCLYGCTIRRVSASGVLNMG